MTGIIFFIIGIAIIFAISYIIYSIRKEINELKIQKDFLKKENDKLLYVKSDLELTKNKLLFDSLELQKNNESISAQIDNQKQHLRDLTEQFKTALDSQTDLSQKAYKNYCDILDKQYEETESAYNNAVNKLSESYNNLQLQKENDYQDFINKINQKKVEYQQELDNIKATREAAIEAARREKQIKEESAFYCIQLSDEDLADITKLESIKKTLNKPRILSMLIWQTWYQKPLKTLSANVLGATDVTGIYKITNIITDECYIGQAVNIRERWAEHAKCGLGIDTPAGNKLYNAMKEYGLHSFSWELLEKCSREQLNEKERYYINLYQADNFGYNSNKGLTK